MNAKRLVWLPLILTLCITALASGSATAQVYRLAIFLENGVQGSDREEILREATRAFTDSRRFVTVERRNLDALTAEKSLEELKGNDSGGLSSLEGVDKIAFVSYLTERRRDSNGRSAHHYVISVRLVEARTGKIEFTIDSDRRVLPLSDNAQAGLGLAAAFVDEGAAAEDAIDFAALAPSPRIAARRLYENIRQLFPPGGWILEISSLGVVVNFGSKHGLGVGDRLLVVRSGDQIVDSISGDLHQGFEHEIGTLKVERVMADMALCKIKKGAKAIIEGDLVRLTESNGLFRGLADTVRFWKRGQ